MEPKNWECTVWNQSILKILSPIKTIMPVLKILTYIITSITAWKIMYGTKKLGMHSMEPINFENTV
jgi:hypothetical protein